MEKRCDEEPRMIEANSISGGIDSNNFKNDQNVMEEQFNTEANNFNTKNMEKEFNRRAANMLDLNQLSGNSANNICENIKNVMEKRFNKDTKMLDLSNFGSDTGNNIVYNNIFSHFKCDLFQI